MLILKNANSLKQRFAIWDISFQVKEYLWILPKFELSSNGQYLRVFPKFEVSWA